MEPHVPFRGVYGTTDCNAIPGMADCSCFRFDHTTHFASPCSNELSPCPSRAGITNSGRERGRHLPVYFFYNFIVAFINFPFIQLVVFVVFKTRAAIRRVGTSSLGQTLHVSVGITDHPRTWELQTFQGQKKAHTFSTLEMTLARTMNITVYAGEGRDGILLFPARSKEQDTQSNNIKLTNQAMKRRKRQRWVTLAQPHCFGINFRLTVTF